MFRPNHWEGHPISTLEFSKQNLKVASPYAKDTGFDGDTISAPPAPRLVTIFVFASAIAAPFAVQLAHCAVEDDLLVLLWMCSEEPMGVCVHACKEGKGRTALVTLVLHVGARRGRRREVEVDARRRNCNCTRTTLKARAKQIGRVGEQTELVDNKPQN